VKGADKHDRVYVTDERHVIFECETCQNVAVISIMHLGFSALTLLPLGVSVITIPDYCLQCLTVLTSVPQGLNTT